MTTIQQQLLALLRAGLHSNYEIENILFPVEHTDWDAIYRLAAQQAVVGIVFDGLNKLPAELQPDKKKRVKWLSMVVCIEQSHCLLNDRVCKIFAFYREHGLNPILLKGQGIALNYPNPLRRSCGDIDIYLGGEDWSRANQLAHDELEISDYDGGEFQHHSSFKWMGVNIENHKAPSTMFNHKGEKELDRLIAKWYPHLPRKVEIAAESISLPSLEFDSFFIFLHIYRHFIYEGIGFRQLNDWAMLLKNNQITEVDTIGLRREWQIFGYVVVNYLGLPKQRMPYYTDRYKKQAEKVVQVIFEDGNFGHMHTKEMLANRQKTYWRGKIYGFGRTLKRTWRICSVSPKFSMQYILYRIKFFVEREIAKR